MAMMVNYGLGTVICLTLPDSASDFCLTGLFFLFYFILFFLSFSLFLHLFYFLFLFL
ncbi:hypothetical protein BDV24DRAFT_131954 [Aspergillus arachidicola]|uniref:Uncharacterized protein n=1 Tax=Aspergillus arachidicola TaxID=656916 RepID=A0A5N6YA61_9EURO|nr:hypothetical protein BDV24DRAFT_131954 [Aspergillus arachidicola]